MVQSLGSRIVGRRVWEVPYEKYELEILRNSPETPRSHEIMFSSLVRGNSERRVQGLGNSRSYQA